MANFWIVYAWPTVITAVEDYYLTNPIARASAVMAECSRLASGHLLTAAE